MSKIKEAAESKELKDGEFTCEKCGKVMPSYLRGIHERGEGSHDCQAKPCKTCGGSGEVGYSVTDHLSGAIDKEMKPCPVCQAKPEASEFTKELRKQYELIDLSLWVTRKEAELIRNTLNKIPQACDIIGSQAAELEKALELARDRLVRADTLASEEAELSALLELGLEHLEQALYYADPPHPTAKGRLAEAQKYLDNWKDKQNGK